VRTALFIPYAGVTSAGLSVTWDGYAERVRPAFAAMGYGLTSIHTLDDPRQAIAAAECVLVGGGNTFHLLKTLYENDLLQPIRDRVARGVPYIGWSAGSVIACPTMRTTNDMPIVEPPSLTALGLIPFQINAHYTDFHPPGFQGETRAERLQEFVAVNPGVRVLGLPEGTMVRVLDDEIVLFGEGEAPVFAKGEPVRRVRAGEDLRWLISPASSPTS
jgi:dipeptidase E